MLGQDVGISDFAKMGAGCKKKEGLRRFFIEISLKNIENITTIFKIKKYVSVFFYIKKTGLKVCPWYL